MVPSLGFTVSNMPQKLTIVVLFLLALSACNRYEPPVNKLLHDGRPLEVEGREVAIGYVAIRLYPLTGESVAAEPASDDLVEADGTFVILGREGKGVPPGKYRVEVMQYDPYPTDVLRGRFSKENSPIEVEVTGEKEPLQIDLAEYGS
jgi:hypothetical protein